MSDELLDYVNKLHKLSHFLLKEQYTDNLDELYREIHSLKAVTYYFKFEDISILLEKTENILFFCRNYDCCIKGVKPWLEHFGCQLQTWSNQIKHGEDIEFFPVFFDTMPTVTCKNFKSSKINKQVEIYIIHKEPTIQNLLYDIFKSSFKYVHIENDVNTLLNAASLPGEIIIISSLKHQNSNIVSLLMGLREIKFNLDNVYALANFPEKRDFINIKDKLQIENVFDLKHQKLSDVKEHISKRFEHHVDSVQIPDNKITLAELSQMIKPLSQTVIELKILCFNDSNTNAIIRVIKNDPMFSAIILKHINTPFMGISNRVSNVAVAVPLLGKTKIGAIVLSEIGKNLFGDDPLKSYGITIEQLLKTSQKRVQFATEWLKRITIDNKKKDEILALLYLLPIGNILIDQAVTHNNDVRHFNNVLDISKHYITERSVVGYTSYEALEKLFTIWNIPMELSTLLKSIREHTVSIQGIIPTTTSSILYLVTTIIQLDGTFVMDKGHERYCERSKMKSADMRSAFLNISDGQTQGVF